MNALLIGYSRIGQRRVLPALIGLEGVGNVSLASRRCKPEAAPAGVRFYQSYEEAIETSGADFAYVSLENSDHALWVERALEHGMHVLVDKPAFLSLHDARRLVQLAARRRRCLAEATVFPHHPQIEALQRVFAQAGTRPTRAVAVFSFPPLDPADFRYAKDRGGGALYDLGPYAVATSRVLFGRAPRSIECRVVARRDDGLDLAFSLLLAYDAEASLVGHFGFDTEYQNRLLVLGPGVSAELDRAFTLPPDAGNLLRLRQNNAARGLPIEPADSFARFLAAALSAIDNGKWDAFPEALLADAELLAALRTSGGVN